MLPVVRLSFDAAEAMRAEGLTSADGNETGGILLGKDVGATVSVQTAGGPGPEAERTPMTFRRDVDHANILADEGYAVDGRVWIGEWHTHPNGPTMPSNIDLQTYAHILSQEDLAFRRLLTIIVTPCAEHCWGHLHANAWIVELAPDGPQAVRIGNCKLEIGNQI